MSKDGADTLVMPFWNWQCSKEEREAGKFGFNPLAARTAAHPECKLEVGRTSPPRAHRIPCSALLISCLLKVLSAQDPSRLRQRVKADPTRAASWVSLEGRSWKIMKTAPEYKRPLAKTGQVPKVRGMEWRSCLDMPHREWPDHSFQLEG